MIRIVKYPVEIVIMKMTADRPKLQGGCSCFGSVLIFGI